MFKFRNLSLAVVACLGLMAGPVLALDVTAADRSKIEARIDQLGERVQALDFAGAIDVVPPRLLRAMAARFGVQPEEIKPAVQAALADAMKNVTLVDFGMDLANAEVLTTPTGGRTYLLVPTWTVMDVEGVGRARVDTKTLAMEDAGQWYLIRVQDAQQVNFLRETYPEFVGVDFPAGETRLVE